MFIEDTRIRGINTVVFILPGESGRSELLLLSCGVRDGGAVTSLVFQGAELLVKDKRIIEG